MAPLIAIVEDDADIRTLLQLELRANGYETTTSSDGASALNSIRKTTPDLILLDIGLPAGDGFTVMERLRNFPQLDSIPIVVISAQASPETRDRARSSGAVAFIEKPIDTALLLRTIDRLRPASG